MMFEKETIYENALRYYPEDCNIEKRLLYEETFPYANKGILDPNIKEVKAVIFGSHINIYYSYNDIYAVRSGRKYRFKGPLAFIRRSTKTPDIIAICHEIVNALYRESHKEELNYE